MFLRLLGLASLAAAATVSDCGGTDALFPVSDLSIKPVDPVPGEDFGLTLTYKVPEGVEITGGTAEYDVTWNYIPFEPTVDPLCQNVPCPLGPGIYTNTSISKWPTGITGLLQTKMKWLDINGGLLACVEIDAMLGSNTSVVKALRGGFHENQTEHSRAVVIRQRAGPLVPAWRGSVQG